MADDTRIKISLFRHADNFRNYPAGHLIFRQGETGTEMFIIRKGQAEIRVGDRVVDALEQDEVFGEMALADKLPRSATAVAVTDCELVPIDTRRFLFLVGQTPNFALVMLQLMAARLRRMDSAVERT